MSGLDITYSFHAMLRQCTCVLVFTYIVSFWLCFEIAEFECTVDLEQQVISEAGAGQCSSMFLVIN